MRFLLVFALTATSTLSALADEAPAPAGDHHGGDHFKNLKVLPADITKDQLKTIMKNMSQGLGVRCAFCHQMEPKDFAADTKHKEIARSMWQMTEKINKDMFTWPDAPKATCYMCHHGEEKPVIKAPPEKHEGEPAPEKPSAH